MTDLGDQPTTVPGASPGGDTKPCPLCGEEIKVIAVKCRHCNSDLLNPAASGPAASGPAAAPPPIVVLAAPPKEFLPTSVLLSLLLLGLAGWLLFVKIPKHDAEALGVGGLFGAALEDRGLLSPEGVRNAKVFAAVLGLLGLVNLLSNSFREVGRIEFCGSCNTQVISRRRFLGRFACERCGTTLSGMVVAAVRGAFLFGFLGLLVLIGSAGAVANMPSRPSSPTSASDAGTLLPQEPWKDRASRVLDQIGTSPLAGQVVARCKKIAHPSGKAEQLVEWKAYADSANAEGIDLRIIISWKGGIIGTNYRFTVKWTLSGSGHGKAIVINDDAPVGIGNAAQALDDYFKNEVYPTVIQRAGTQ